MISRLLVADLLEWQPAFMLRASVLNTVFITKDWQGQSSVSEGVENWIGEVKISGIDLSKKLENHLKTYAGIFWI